MKGLILRRTLYGEADLILQVLLEDHRILSFFAAGARKSKRRFPHQFDLTGLYDWEWNRQGNEEPSLRRLIRADLIDWRPQLAQDLESWARWAVVLEALSHPEASSGSLADVLEVREILSQSPTQGALAYHHFLFQLMALHGVQPELQDCVVCHRPVGIPASFSIEHGGIAHRRCHPHGELQASTLQFMRNSLRGSLPPADLFVVIDDLDQISIPYLTQQLGRVLKSQEVFWQLKHRASPVALDPSRELAVE